VIVATKAGRKLEQEGKGSALAELFVIAMRFREECGCCSR